MKITVSAHEFREAFRKYGRDNSFSYDGIDALFEYLEDLERDTGIEDEFDVVGICGDYTEYEDLEEFHDNYDKEDYPDIESIKENTAFIDIHGGGFIIGNL